MNTLLKKTLTEGIIAELVQFICIQKKKRYIDGLSSITVSGLPRYYKDKRY